MNKISASGSDFSVISPDFEKALTEIGKALSKIAQVTAGNTLHATVLGSEIANSLAAIEQTSQQHNTSFRIHGQLVEEILQRQVALGNLCESLGQSVVKIAQVVESQNQMNAILTESMLELSKASTPKQSFAFSNPSLLSQQLNGEQ